MVLALTLGLIANGCSSDDKPNVQLVSIQVNPDAAKIVVGETKQYAAVGTFDDLSTRDISAEVVWNSSNNTAATISETGLATGITEGSTTIITAAAGSLVSNQASLEVVSESNRLISIAIEPTTAQIQLGASLSFEAIGTYQDSSVRTITAEVLWESTNPTIVAISNTPGSKGVAVGLASGSSDITASTLDIVSDPVTATVTEVALETISISPADPTLPLGTTQKFKATGTYSDNSTADLTKVVTWMSSNKVVADFSAEPGEEGFCTTLAEGSTSITAIHGSVISDPVTLTVTSASLVIINIEPTAPNVPVGAEVQFSATGIYSDGGTHDLTDSVAWFSSDETKVAFESATLGLALAKAEGSAQIWCSRNQLESNRATMTVSSATLESIEISPVNPSVPIGQQIQLTAFGHYSDQNVVDITNTATWDSTVKTVATVSNAAGTKGLTTGLTEGTTVISAAVGNIRGEATLQVKNIEIISIVVTPTGATLPVGEKLQYVATATFNDTSQAEVTSVVTWHVGSTLVADIGNSAADHGQATAIGVGNTTVWCVSTNGVASSPVGLTVTSASLVSIAITPNNPSVVIGATQQFTAMGRYTDGSQLDITADVLWESSDETIATISNSAGTKGLATTSLVGATNITATKDLITSPPSRLSVVSPNLESIAVTPSNANIDVGVTIQYTAMGHYSDNQDRDITTQCYWESSATAIASVSNGAGTRGQVTGNAQGNAQITASYQTVTSPAVPVTVNTPVNQQPVAVLEGDATATVGVQATYTGASSYDPDGTITNYTFNFGDGTGDIDNGTNPVINHTCMVSALVAPRLSVTVMTTVKVLA
ncbi:Ig-like domain-containing protein, partial [Myxococcota bacterium]